MLHHHSACQQHGMYRFKAAHPRFNFDRIRASPHAIGSCSPVETMPSGVVKPRRIGGRCCCAGDTSVTLHYVGIYSARLHTRFILPFARRRVPENSCTRTRGNMFAKRVTESIHGWRGGLYLHFFRVCLFSPVSGAAGGNKVLKISCVDIL